LIQAATISDKGILNLGEYKGIIQIWDIDKFSFIGNIEYDPITALSFNPEKREVLVGTQKGQVLLFTVDNVTEKNAE